MPETNLLNSVWYFNETISLENKTFDIRYGCLKMNKSAYIGLVYDSSGSKISTYQWKKPYRVEDTVGLNAGTDGTTFSYSGIFVDETTEIEPIVYYKNKGFVDVKWRTVFIRGGNDIDDPEFIGWISQNAELIGYATDYDLTGLGLEEAIHQISLDHSMNGYCASGKTASVKYDNRTYYTVNLRASDPFDAGTPYLRYSLNNGTSWVNPSFDERGDEMRTSAASIKFRVNRSSGGGKTVLKKDGVIVIESGTSDLNVDSENFTLRAPADYTVGTVNA